jgi:hypothetical protein
LVPALKRSFARIEPSSYTHSTKNTRPRTTTIKSETALSGLANTFGEGRCPERGSRDTEVGRTKIFSLDKRIKSRPTSTSTREKFALELRSWPRSRTDALNHDSTCSGVDLGRPLPAKEIDKLLESRRETLRGDSSLPLSARNGDAELSRDSSGLDTSTMTRHELTFFLTKLERLLSELLKSGDEPGLWKIRVDVQKLISELWSNDKLLSTEHGRDFIRAAIDTWRDTTTFLEELSTRVEEARDHLSILLREAGLWDSAFIRGTDGLWVPFDRSS